MNLSSNQYHEYPTTTDWHSSLVNQAEDNIEELHFHHVKNWQKANKLLGRIEKAKRNINGWGKRSKRRGSKRGERRKADSETESEAGYEYVKAKNSNVQIWLGQVDL